MSPRYTLHYWPTLQGRGEFARLLLEATSTPYIDRARQPEAEGGGFPSVQAIREAEAHPPVYAPPILQEGEALISQTAAICQHLAARHGLEPQGGAARAQALALFLTVMDVVSEAHDTHHPIAKGLYYEDQKAAALERAKAFREARMPRFFDYFERALIGPGLFGARLTYPDLALFQLLEGLEYAFPRAYARLRRAKLEALRGWVRDQPGVAAYLASPRRIPFNEDGIFRRYPELDDAG